MRSRSRKAARKVSCSRSSASAAVARDLDEVAADAGLVGAEERLEAGVEQHAAVEIGGEVALVDGELIHYFMTCRRVSDCDIGLLG